MKKAILILAIIAISNPNAQAQQTTESNDDFKVITQTGKEAKKKKDENDGTAFRKGNIAITVGYGFPNLYKALHKSFIVNLNNLGDPYGTTTYAYSANAFGPTFLKVDYGVTKLIGLGLTAGYFNSNITQTATYTVSEYNSSTSTYIDKTYQDVTKYTYSSLSIGARINFHFGTGEKLDPYAGVALGYSSNTVKQTYSTNNPNATVSAPYNRTGIPTHFAITVGMRYYFTPNIGIYGELGFDKWSLIQGGLAIKF